MAGELQALTEATIQRLPAKQRMAFTLLQAARPRLRIDRAEPRLFSAETARARVFQALRKIRDDLDGHALPRTESTR